jgi:hypothetical protein
MQSKSNPWGAYKNPNTAAVSWGRTYERIQQLYKGSHLILLQLLLKMTVKSTAIAHLHPEVNKELKLGAQSKQRACWCWCRSEKSESAVDYEAGQFWAQCYCSRVIFTNKTNRMLHSFAHAKQCCTQN